MNPVERRYQESLPFLGSVHEVRQQSWEHPDFGKQTAIIYFTNIGGRGDPTRYEWRVQPAEKMDQYETALIDRIKAGFSDYPVVIVVVPPHACSLFAFGSPLAAGESEVNLYVLATLNVPDMTIKANRPSGPLCPLDVAIRAYESGLWNQAPTLEEYLTAQRNAGDIRAQVVNSNKVLDILKLKRNKD